MGNAPLSKPPPSSRSRAVLKISTRERCCGRTLAIVYDDEENDQQNREQDESSSAATANCMPPALMQAGHISHTEYQDKLQLLEDRLLAWKGGWTSLIWASLAIVLILGFIAAFFTPQFWASAFLDQPFWLCAIGVSQIAMYIYLWRRTRQETRHMLDDVEDLFRSWRAMGVHVSMKPVAGLATSSRGGVHQQQRGYDRYAGRPCFCVVMHVARNERTINNENEEEDDDLVSVGTFKTLDSVDHSEDGDEEHDDRDDTEEDLDLEACL